MESHDGISLQLPVQNLKKDNVTAFQMLLSITKFDQMTIYIMKFTVQENSKTV